MTTELVIGRVLGGLIAGGLVGALAHGVASHDLALGTLLGSLVGAAAAVRLPPNLDIISEGKATTTLIRSIRDGVGITVGFLSGVIFPMTVLLALIAVLVVFVATTVGGGNEGLYGALKSAKPLLYYLGSINAAILVVGLGVARILRRIWR